MFVEFDSHNLSTMRTSNARPAVNFNMLEINRNITNEVKSTGKKYDMGSSIYFNFMTFMLDRRIY